MALLIPSVLCIAVALLATFPFVADAQADPAAAAGRELSKAIIRRVEFHDTDFDTVMSTLQQTFRQSFVRRHRQPYSFSFFLKRPVGTPVPGEELAAPLPPLLPPIPHITLSLRRVSVLQALRQVAAQIGMRVIIEQYTVAFLPIDENTDPLVTVALRTPLKFIGLTDVPSEAAIGGPAEPHMDAKSILESCGMTFPLGAAAIYFPSTHRLILRNTRKNLDLVGDVPRFDDK